MIPIKDARSLLPFLVSTFTYTFCSRPHSEVSPLACLIKAAPILALALFVWTQGVRVPSRQTYSKFIFVSLLFSALGDTLIQLKDQGLFLHGMAAFALSQALFILAFGTTPVDLLVGIPINLAGLAYYVFLHSHPLVANDPMFATALLIYSLVICTMLWRALTRWRMGISTAGKNGRRSKWLFVGFLGAVSFVISDSSLAWWMVVGPYRYSQAVIMGTYYMAQLLISLSIFHEEAKGSARIGRKTSSGGGGGAISGTRMKGRKVSASRRQTVVDSSKDSTRPFDSLDKGFRMYDKAVIYKK